MTIQYNKVIFASRIIPKVKTTDETLNTIVKGNISVSRYGDGEFSLMKGENLIFQPCHGELRERLKEIIKTSREKHIVCIPNVFESLDWCAEAPSNYWRKYLNINRRKIYTLLDMKKEYHDSLVTRLYIDHNDKDKAEERFEKLKRLWNYKDIVIVEGEQSRLGVGNDLFKNVRSIQRIICPPKDAFSRYSEILNEVKKQDKSKLILIALGPTATVLAFDLSRYGFHAVDIGHIDIEYEWFLKKATKKQPVRNKYIGEVSGGSDVDEIRDEKYEKEIFVIIK
ncbi:SP_1767 family glycosyltransferase [Neobacillus drentensis]|uniref:SP_1767 family glycosyltransferase n=1 Tax=Neobacillus drentensis TaxID=220684 RepID=UPI0030039454